MKKLVFSTIIGLLSFVFVPLSSIAQIPSYVPTSGLVGWWPFNANANDESGNGNNGTVNGATLTTDRFGLANKAYSFDGVNDFIQTPIDNSNYSAGITISAWVNIVGANSINNPQFAISKEWDQVNGHFALLWNNNLIGGDLNNLASGGISIPQNIPFGNFKHICFTYNGSQLSLYSNGILLNSTPYSNVLNSVSSTIFFGKHQGFDALTYYFLNGKIDDIAIYNRALSLQEITNLYTSSAPPTITTTASPAIINCGESATLTASSTSAAQPCIKTDLPATLQNGLVGYWPFCGNANDASGNGNNGTVDGATLTTDRFGNSNNAYSFNGNSITTNFNLISGISERSMSFWFKPTANSNSGERCLVGFGGSNSCGAFFDCNLIENSTIRLNFGVAYIDFFSNPINSNEWNFVTVTYTNNGSNSSSIKLSLNGVILNSSTSLEPCLINTQNIYNLRFGRNAVSSVYLNDYFGKLDDIAIYNRALTATEIQQLYSLGNVNYTWSTGATTPSISVTPAQTTAYTCTATNSAGSTTSSVTVTVADSLSWTGLFDTDWHKPCNWSPQFVPKCCNNVAIPMTSNQPIVSGVAAAEDLTIYTTNGALLTVNTGANLQIADCPTTITTATCPSLAVLTTTAVSSITQTTAISGGTISYQGASAITARGVCWSTSINPTLANSFTTNGIGIGTFTSNLTGLTAGTTYYVRAYATNASGTSYGNQLSFVAVNPQPAYPTNSVFCASGPTLVVDVTSPTGKTWMDRNLGASQVATSSTDTAAYGDLYQWGRRSDGHQCRNSATTTTLSSTDQPGNGNFILAPNSPFDWRNPQNTNLWQGVNGVNNPCPIGYRIPTETELEAERISWSSQNSAGAFASLLKLPLAGYRLNSSGSLGLVGTNGGYWSSTVSGASSRDLGFDSSVASMFFGNKAYGTTVRCIKN